MPKAPGYPPVLFKKYGGVWGKTPKTRMRVLGVLAKRPLGRSSQGHFVPLGNVGFPPTFGPKGQKALRAVIWRAHLFCTFAANDRPEGLLALRAKSRRDFGKVLTKLILCRVALCAQCNWQKFKEFLPGSLRDPAATSTFLCLLGPLGPKVGVETGVLRTPVFLRCSHFFKVGYMQGGFWGFWALFLGENGEFRSPPLFWVFFLVFEKTQK